MTPFRVRLPRPLFGVGCALFAVALVNRGDGSVHFLVSVRPGWLNRWMDGATALGDFTWIASLSVAVVVISWAWGKWPRGVPLGVAVGGTSLTVAVIKLLVARPRPAAAAYLEPSFSFPSGHAALAAATYGYLVGLAWQGTAARSRRALAAVVGVVTILAVGFSRVYFGVHYASDVVAGYLVGLGWWWVACGIRRFLERRYAPFAPPVARSGRWLLTAAAGAIPLAVYFWLVLKSPA